MQNIDCLAHILSYLTVRERESCRQVNHRWMVSADELARTQRSLTIIGKRDSSNGSGRRCSLNGYRSSSQYIRNQCSNVDSHTSIHWPYNFIRYQYFVQMLTRFSNIRTICFDGIEYWNDHLIGEMSLLLPRVKSLNFIRCVGIGRSRIYEKNFMNVTVNGWNRLIEMYGNQVTKLTLRECDLDDHQLEIIIMGFRCLTYLDISSNRIGVAGALSRICPTIEILKVGPRLIGNNVSADIPIEKIIAGPARYVTELSIQGFLSSKLTLISHLCCLTKLTIRFMKPLFDDINITNCFAAIGRLRSLRCLEIYQHNTHDCYMAVSRDHLLSIFSGCNQLEQFVFNCDIWCDSPLDDQLFVLMRQCCPNLQLLDLCPGNFQTTDHCLQTLATFPALKNVRIVEFSGITEYGLMKFIHDSVQLSRCVVEDCCDINTNAMIDFVRKLYYEKPYNRLEMIIIPLRSLQIPTEMFHIPEHDPIYRLTIFGQKDRNKPSSSFMDGAGKMWNHRSAYHSIETLIRLTFNTVISAFTFISTLFIFGAACCFYLLHMILLSINSRFSFNNFVLGIPFLTTGMIAFLSSLFIGPCLYLSTHVFSVILVDLTDVFDGLARLYGDTGH